MCTFNLTSQSRHKKIWYENCSLQYIWYWSDGKQGHKGFTCQPWNRSRMICVPDMPSHVKCIRQRKSKVEHQIEPIYCSLNKSTYIYIKISKGGHRQWEKWATVDDQQPTNDNWKQESKQPPTATPDIQWSALDNPTPDNKQKTITIDRYTHNQNQRPTTNSQQPNRHEIKYNKTSEGFTWHVTPSKDDLKALPDMRCQVKALLDFWCQ